MKKIKNILLMLVFWAIGLLVSVKPALAISPTIVISKLPEYITYQTFKLSYSALTDNPSSIQVQFYSMKEGGSYSAFGSVKSGASGQVDVDSNQVGESGKKYCFKAEIVGLATSNETCTIFDNSGPDSVGGFSKEKLGPSTYKIKWHTPNNNDFAQVYIYRGDEPGFEADSGHFVYAQGGEKDKDMEWTDAGADPTKEHYYLIRALDKAGNSSGLVGDAKTTTETVYASGSPVSGSTSGKVVSLPTEGEVLGNETTVPEEVVVPSPTEAPGGVLGQAVQFAQNKTKLTVAIVAGVILVGGFLYLKLRRKAS